MKKTVVELRLALPLSVMSQLADLAAGQAVKAETLAARLLGEALREAAQRSYVDFAAAAGDLYRLNAERRVKQKRAPRGPRKPQPKAAPAEPPMAPAEPPRSDSAATHPNLATTRVVFGDAVARRGSLAVAPETAPAKPKQRDPVERRWLLALRPAIEARKSLAVFDNFEPSDVLLAQRLAKEAPHVG